MSRYFTAAAVDEAITPPVRINYTKLLINGQFIDSTSGKTFPTLDPRTGEVIANVAEAEAEDVNRAVSAARKAFDEGPWPKMSAHDRSKILLKFVDLLEKHSEELAALETWDNGKPYERSVNDDIPLMIRFFRYYAGCTCISLWQHSCTETSEQTPLSALLASKLLQEAGLPPGVLNVISGYGPTVGAPIASHMNVDKLAFTGSTDTGKIVLELAAKSNLKPVTLELGGKSPLIVCEDADVDKAVETAHSALFYNQGQCCSAGSRTFVHERVYSEFVEKARELALKRVVGDPFKKGVQQGPQIDSEQFEKILKYINFGINSGATLEAGGERFGSKGYYVQPTVFSSVEDDMPIARDEIFGPVQSISKFRNINEVIGRANATNFGLAAGVFTKDLDNANMLSRALRVGTVWVNCYNVFDASIPFGGYKMSGNGREKGIYGLSNYLQVKSVVTPLKNPAWL
ncbi:hypothetical protein RD792_016617 [Penstemon davidsonii]|uniref:Aldehyde dehydrogenase domain-containing protein n=1 Tax=Penstemon davidsonii TaxID=160366 RepID=A0ABR0CLQ5_9LAMI|nr:hypothetical protein RD792_016617 [Penstemon davidsonii]